MSSENNNNIFLNGLNLNFRNSVCINYDHIQNLCAIGFNDGIVKIVGEYGYEITFKSKENSLIKNIYFLDGLPNLIIVTEKSIEKWDYEIGSEVLLLRILSLKNEERIISSSLENGLEYLVFALDNSNIRFLNVYQFFYSNHLLGYPAYFYDRKSIFGKYITTTANQSSLEDIIGSYHLNSITPYSNKDINSGRKNSDLIYPTCLKLSPVNADLLLVGYSNGLIVVWSIKDKMIEKRFFTKSITMSYCTSVDWTRKGTKIVCSFLNGEIYLINYSNFERRLLYKPPPVPKDDRKFKYNENVNQSMKLIYSNDRKILLIKGYFSLFQGNNRSVYLIKFGKFKDNYSVCGVSSDIGPFCIVSSSRYFNDHNQTLVKSIIAVNLNEQLIEFKFNLSTSYLYPNYLKEFNNKSMNNFPKLISLKQFKLNSNNNIIIESIHSSLYHLSNDISNISGGLYTINNSKDNCEILITSHIDKTLYFWDSTDSKNLIYLGLLDISEFTNEIITYSLINSTLIISVKDKQNISNNSLLIYRIINNEAKAILKRIFKLDKDHVENKDESDKEEERKEKSIDKYNCKVINEGSILETNVIKLFGEIKFENEIITNITPIDTNSTAVNFIIGSNVGEIYKMEIIQTDNINNGDSIISTIQIVLNSSCNSVGKLENEPDLKSISSIKIYESNAFIGYSNGEILIMDLDKMKFKKKISKESLKLKNINSPIDSINIINSSNTTPSSSSQKLKMIISSNKEISIFNITLIKEFNQVSFNLIKSIEGSFISGTNLSSLFIKNESNDQTVIVALEINQIGKALLNIYSATDLELLKSNPLDTNIKLSSNTATLFSVSKLYSNSFIYQFNNKNNNNQIKNNSNNNNNNNESSSILYSICLDKNQLKKYYKLFNYHKVTKKVFPNNSSTILNLLGFNFESSYNSLNNVLSKVGNKIIDPQQFKANGGLSNEVKKNLMNQHSSLTITCLDASYKFHRSSAKVVVFS